MVKKQKLRRWKEEPVRVVILKKLDIGEREKKFDQRDAFGKEKKKKKKGACLRFKSIVGSAEFQGVGISFPDSSDYCIS